MKDKLLTPEKNKEIIQYIIFLSSLSGNIEPTSNMRDREKILLGKEIVKGFVETVNNYISYLTEKEKTKQLETLLQLKIKEQEERLEEIKNNTLIIQFITNFKLCKLTIDSEYNKETLKSLNKIIESFIDATKTLLNIYSETKDIEVLKILDNIQERLLKISYQLTARLRS